MQVMICMMFWKHEAEDLLLWNRRWEHRRPVQDSLVPQRQHNVSSWDMEMILLAFQLPWSFSQTLKRPTKVCSPTQKHLLRSWVEVEIELLGKYWSFPTMANVREDVSQRSSVKWLLWFIVRKKKTTNYTLHIFLHVEVTVSEWLSIC